MENEVCEKIGPLLFPESIYFPLGIKSMLSSLQNFILEEREKKIMLLETQDTSMFALNAGAFHRISLGSEIDLLK